MGSLEECLGGVRYSPVCFVEIGEPKLPYIYSLGTFVTWPVISSRREWYWRDENSDSSVSVVCLSF